jgi:hypothetical protein
MAVFNTFSSSFPVHDSELFRISSSLLAESSALPPLLMLPDQVSSPHRVLSGTRALMLAVLESAMRDYQQQYVSVQRGTVRLAREAEAWFWSEDTDWPFSFLNICDALEFQPAYFRRQLLQIRQHPSAGN